MDFGLTDSEKKQLLTLLDKVQANHCKNYHSSRHCWNCARESDDEVCPLEFEYENNIETEYCEDDGGFYCPVFLIRNVLGDGEN